MKSLEITALEDLLKNEIFTPKYVRSISRADSISIYLLIGNVLFSLCGTSSPLLAEINLKSHKI